MLTIDLNKDDGHFIIKNGIDTHFWKTNMINIPSLKIYEYCCQVNKWSITTMNKVLPRLPIQTK